MIIESLRVRNYKALRDVRLTKMPRLAVFVGANGSGKSTLLDVFAFLQDCVRNSLYVAVERRGGVDEVFSRDSLDSTLVEIEFRLEKKSSVLTYSLEIDRLYDYPRVVAESLKETFGRGRTTFVHMAFSDQQGFVTRDVIRNGEAISGTPEQYEFSDDDDLALRALGRFKAYSLISRVRQRLEAWHCTTATAQLSGMPRTGHARESLNIAGTNVAEFALYMQQNYRRRFDGVIQKLGRCVPGLETVEAVETPEGWTDLRFKDQAFYLPFGFEAMSEGTRKLFTTFLMLNEPTPHPLLTIEEPENDLYPALMWPLAEEFRAYADRGSQILVSTHSPDFVNALNLDEVYWMEKRDGYAHVVRAKDDPNVRSQKEGGALLGSLWTEGFFGKAHPR